MTKTKTKIKTANDRILEEVAFETGLSKEQVSDITKIQGEYTVRVMRMGTLEGVMWPLFGKIKVKAKRVYKMFHAYGNSTVRKNTTRPK